MEPASNPVDSPAPSEPPSSAQNTRDTLSPRPDTRAWWLALALASLALVASLWVVPYLPTNDGPEHVLLGHLENHLADPGAVYSHYLRPAPQFASRGFAVLFVPLEALLPWRHALRLTLSAGLLLWAWGFVALVRVLAPTRRWVALLGFACACQWSLYMGFFSFLLGSALSMHALSLALTPGLRPAVRTLSLSALLLAQAMAHVFSATLTLAVLGLLAACDALPRTSPHAPGSLAARALALARLALLATPALVVLGFTLAEGSTVRQTAFTQHTQWLGLAEWLRVFPRAFLVGSPWRGLLALCGALAGIALTAARRARRDPSLTRPEGALALASALLLAASALAPWSIPGWQYFFPRFAPLGTMLGLALLPLERVRAQRRAALAALSLTALLLATAAQLHLRLARACADAYALLDAPLPRATLLLPVPAETACNSGNDWIARDVPALAPCLHFGALYAAQHGGLPRYMFQGSNAGHSVALHTPMPSAPSVEHLVALGGGPSELPLPVLLDEFAAAGVAYDTVLFFGFAREQAYLARRGYERLFSQGESWVGRFRGCPARLRVPLREGEPEPEVELGWSPHAEPSWRAEPGAVRATEPDGAALVALTQTPCGPFWLRVRWDRDRSGTPSPADALCRGADSEGRLVVRDRRDPLLRCEPDR